MDGSDQICLKNQMFLSAGKIPTECINYLKHLR